jgi:hypothetical protein
MDHIKELLRAIAPNSEPFWVAVVGRKLAAAKLTERQLIRLTRKSILHAYGVNQKYFENRISQNSLAVLEQVMASIEDVSYLRDFPSTDMVELLKSITPDEDSIEDTVPGWGSLLDAVRPFVRYPSERNLESLVWAIGDAYHSVSSRACAEFHGVEGNCGFMHDQKEIEANNPLCAQEIAFQLEQLADGK